MSNATKLLADLWGLYWPIYSALIGVTIAGVSCMAAQSRWIRNAAVAAVSCAMGGFAYTLERDVWLGLQYAVGYALVLIVARLSIDVFGGWYLRRRILPQEASSRRGEEQWVRFVCSGEMPREWGIMLLPFASWGSLGLVERFRSGRCNHRSSVDAVENTFFFCPSCACTYELTNSEAQDTKELQWTAQRVSAKMMRTRLSLHDYTQYLVTRDSYIRKCILKHRARLHPDRSERRAKAVSP